MRIIGMLLGIPEEDQEAIRDSSTPASTSTRTTRLRPTTCCVGDRLRRTTSTGGPSTPSDDLMTELLNAEFTDETGTLRTLTREEVLTYVGLIAGAGNETTTRLIGWTGKVLAEHPDQRRELAEDRSLIPNAIEELLRYEAPSPVQARSVTRDIEHHGTTVPEGSVMLLHQRLGQPRRPALRRRLTASTSTATSATT